MLSLQFGKIRKKNEEVMKKKERLIFQNKIFLERRMKDEQKRSPHRTCKNLK